MLVSRIALKSAVEARREYRTQLDGGEGARIQVNNVAQAAARSEATVAPVRRPRLVSAADAVEDAHLLTEETDG